MLREESKHRSASELKRVKSVHADQLRELQTQLERLMEERGVTGKEIGQLRGALKGVCVSDNACMHAQTNTHAHMHTHARTHAHTRLCVCI